MASGGHATTRELWPLAAALSRDDRMPIAELARLTDRTPATTRRQVAQLLLRRTDNQLRPGRAGRWLADRMLLAGQGHPE